jgi:hypothetical protein
VGEEILLLNQNGRSRVGLGQGGSRLGDVIGIDVAPIQVRGREAFRGREQKTAGPARWLENAIRGHPVPREQFTDGPRQRERRLKIAELNTDIRHLSRQKDSW